ncbi:unnamed protein product [Withania somnifera]
MNIKVIDIEGQKRQKSGERVAEPNQNPKQDVADNFAERDAVIEVDDGEEKPYVGMEFQTEEDAKDFFDAHARRVGFSISVGQYSRSKPDGPIISWEFSCSREVFRRKNIESCSAMLRLERKSSDSWIVTKFIEDHNHSIVNPSKVHYLQPRKHFSGASRTVGEVLGAPTDAMVPPVVVPVEGNHVFVSSNEGFKDASPMESNRVTKNFSPVIPIMFVQPCTENPGFYYAIQLDDENRMTNAFWADARSRIAYSHFGDAVIFDTMYRPNQFQVPFAPFTGVNHHGQMSSFTWLFRTWLSSMNNRPPVSITTDQDRAIKAAVNLVLPGTRHCICKWHILREGQERLGHVYMAHPSFYGELYSCINYSETIEDFESSWASVLDKYNLGKNEWLQAVYNARDQWAPVYFRDTFFAALPLNQGVTSFFDGYVNRQTTLPVFFKQYERALERSLEREIASDVDTNCITPVLRTPSPMEQQVANVFTKKVFAKFQEELVETFAHTANKIDGDETLSKFRVAKYEQDDKAYIVMLNLTDMKTSCSCQMFEYSGILCRHILTVFTVTNVLTVPSHYIPRRWTRNAKVGLGSDEECMFKQGINSLTSRFNHLCLEALRYAEVGAVSAETYDAAVSSLRDGLRKISTLAKNVARPLSSQGSGSTQDDNMKRTSATSDTAPSLWHWQDRAPHHFNLNDGGLIAGDLNQPTMTPVAINHDGGLADNVVVYTCFKSMTWVIENNSPASKVAVINLKLQDYGKNLAAETEVQFRLTRVTLEPMLKSMAQISQQLSLPSNRVAVINLKLQDTKTPSGDTEVKFQVSRDTLGSMLRSMAYIREQL